MNYAIEAVIILSILAVVAVVLIRKKKGGSGFKISDITGKFKGK
jgi:preprotein translocase subunit SecG